MPQLSRHGQDFFILLDIYLFCAEAIKWVKTMTNISKMNDRYVTWIPQAKSHQRVHSIVACHNGIV